MRSPLSSMKTERDGLCSPTERTLPIHPLEGSGRSSFSQGLPYWLRIYS